MTLTTERQQFEEWFNKEMVLRVSESDETVVRLMWKAWQASRELLADREAPPAPAVPDGSDPRDAFESVFPMPKYVVRCGTGYVVTACSAWGAHDFKERWVGWNACRSAMLDCTK